MGSVKGIIIGFNLSGSAVLFDASETILSKTGLISLLMHLHDIPGVLWVKTGSKKAQVDNQAEVIFYFGTN
jgi:hypothetical protein